MAPATPGPKARFGLIRFRSPLLTESRLISFPTGTKMCQFPALASDRLCIHLSMTPSACTVTPGCPIRKSQDQSSFGSSPGLIAAYHVLHRLITPRHPPCTLYSLATFAVGPSTKANVLSLVALSIGEISQGGRPEESSLPAVPMYLSKSLQPQAPPALAAVSGSHGAIMTPASPRGVASYTTIGLRHQVFYVDSGEKTQ